MSRAVGSPKGAKKKADVLFSSLIRSRGACENCGSTAYLQCAHIVSRRFSATRCDPDNAFCLCAKCHHYFTDWPNEWVRFVGEDRYRRLMVKAQVPTLKVDWNAEAARLRDLLREVA